MNKGFFACETLGAVVEKSVADKFRENLNGISTTDAIQWFIFQIATEKMHIARVDEE